MQQMLQTLNGSLRLDEQQQEGVEWWTLNSRHSDLPMNLTRYHYQTQEFNKGFGRAISVYYALLAVPFCGSDQGVVKVRNGSLSPAKLSKSFPSVLHSKETRKFSPSQHLRLERVTMFLQPIAPKTSKNDK